MTDIAGSQITGTVHRHCDYCGKVQLFWIRRHEGKTYQQCTFCFRNIRRYDIRPRSWAGV